MATNPFNGAICLADDITLAEIWLTVHQSAIAWARILGQPGAALRQTQMTESDIKLLQLLSSVECPRWLGMSEACGLTTTGLMAAGWSKNAPLLDIAAQWGALLQVQAQPFALSARLFPAHLVPQFPRLTAAVQWSANNHALLALTIHAQSKMVLDLPQAHLSNAPPLVSAALALRGSSC